MGSEDEVVTLREQVARLEGRVTQLEQRLTFGQQSSAAPVAPPAAPTMMPPPPGPQPLPAPPPRGRVAPSVPTPAISAEALLRWAGLVLVVLAAVFFVGTAISRGWIGPELQLAGATLIGLALVVGGFRLKATNRPWAVTLTLGGAVVLPVCAAASNGGLDLLSEYPALVALAMVTVGLGRVAMKLSMHPVAVVAAIAAVVLPFWIVDDIDLPVAVIGGWMSALVIGATWLGWQRTWILVRLVTVLLAGFVLISIAASEDVASLSRVEQVIALIVTAVVAITAWVGPAFVPTASTAMKSWQRHFDHRSVLLIPLWTWSMIGAIVSFEGSVRYAVAGFVIAALFAGAAVVSVRLPSTLVAAHFLAVGVLVSIAFAVLTSGPALLVALAVQAAATAVLARMMRDLLLTLFAALLALIALVWVALSMLNGWFEPLDGGRHIANLIVVAMVVAVAAYGWYRRSASLAGPLTVLGWVLALTWLASVLAHVTQGQVAISFLWAVAAASALIYGVGRDLQLARVMGITTLVVVLAKLLTVDLAAVDTLWRVGLFLVVGAGLLRLAYILPRLPTREDSQLR